MRRPRLRHAGHPKRTARQRSPPGDRPVALPHGRRRGRAPPCGAGWGTLGRDDPGARVARPRVRTARAARDRSTPRSARSRRSPSAALDDVRPGLAAGRHAGADRPHLRRHRRLRPRPLRHRHARRRPRPAEPGRDPRRAARLVRPGRRARACSTWAGPARPTPRCAWRRCPRPVADAAAACAASPATSTWSTSTATRPSCRSSCTGLRVFAGYAGWSPGQLAGEIAEGAWACVPGAPDDVLSEVAGPGAVARGHGPADRAAGRALHRARGSHRRTDGCRGARRASGRKCPGRGGLGKRPPLSRCLVCRPPARGLRARARPRAPGDRPPPRSPPRRQVQRAPAVVGQRRRSPSTSPSAAAASRTGPAGRRSRRRRPSRPSGSPNSAVSRLSIDRCPCQV